MAAHLDRRDTFVLYTDGATEALGSGGEMFGEERLGQSTSTGSAQQTVDGIIGRLEAWSDTRADDVTLVVARRL